MRENFVTYNDEPDEDKVAALLDKASRDAEYVLHKVCARCLAPRSSGARPTWRCDAVRARASRLTL